MYQRSSVSQVKSENQPQVILRLGEKFCPKRLSHREDLGILPADALNVVAV
jgi:hypothetical protein